VVHVEHGIRGEESKQDAEFVENFCKKHEKFPVKYIIVKQKFMQESIK